MGIFSKIANLFREPEDGYDLILKDMRYQIPNHTRTDYASYLLPEDLLKDLRTREGQSIRLRLEDPKKINYPKEHLNSDTLNFIQTYARLGLFDEQNNLYGLLGGSDLEKFLGVRDLDQSSKHEGEWVDCIIHITSQNNVELYVPNATTKTY